MRPSTITRFISCGRTRGASIAACTDIPNSITFPMNCGDVSMIPYDPGVPMHEKSLPSRQIIPGDRHISFFLRGPITFGLSPSRSNQCMKLFSMIPVPSTTTPKSSGSPATPAIVTAPSPAVRHSRCWIVPGTTPGPPPTRGSPDEGFTSNLSRVERTRYARSHRAPPRTVPFDSSRVVRLPSVTGVARVPPRPKTPSSCLTQREGCFGLTVHLPSRVIFTPACR